MSNINPSHKVLVLEIHVRTIRGRSLENFKTTRWLPADNLTPWNPYEKLTGTRSLLHTKAFWNKFLWYALSFKIEVSFVTLHMKEDPFPKLIALIGFSIFFQSMKLYPRSRTMPTASTSALGTLIEWHQNQHTLRIFLGPNHWLLRVCLWVELTSNLVLLHLSIFPNPSTICIHFHRITSSYYLG